MHRFSFPTTIHFGAGASQQIGEFLKSKGFKRPLIVTDKGVAALPLCKQIETQLQKSQLQSQTFSGIWGNPVESQVTAGVKAFKSHDSDCIVGLGGGAALDVAKAIALMAKHPGNLFDYEDEKPGGRNVDGDIPYWIAIPTTSGTGSEVGRSSVISDDKTHVKKIIFSPKLLAQTVFADPELTFDLPAAMTAATGMDALTHCVEAYLAKAYHPICEGIALEGIRLAGKSLVKSVKEPRDLEARSNMMMCSMMGAIAFQKGLGVTHSCAHALGTVVDMHHGLANGIMIDFALKINAEVAAEKFKNMAVTVGLKDATAAGFLNWLREIKTQVGIPKNLTAAGVKRDNLEKLVELSINDGCHPSNPRAVSKDDFKSIFNEAF